jgi:putative transposase
MSECTVREMKKPEVASDSLSELLRQGARRLIEQAVEAELAEFLAQRSGLSSADGRAQFVRNGHLPEREILTGIGPVSVRIPKVRSRGEVKDAFHSELVPPYVRKTRSIESSLPWLYLKGISGGDLQEALGVLVGPEAKGLSVSVLNRLKQEWSLEYQRWSQRSIAEERYVYLWADGIYSGLRGEDEKLCALVIIGADKEGQKHFLTVVDGVRESTQSWREVLLDLKSRGLNTPSLAIGDGALGFWGAIEEVFPETKHQRCWAHKTANILNKLPKTSQPKAKQALHQIWMAEDRKNAEKSFDLFIQTYGAKYDKATHCLEKDRTKLLAFYDFPAEQWNYIRTTNPIESTFSTIRHRTRKTRGCVTRCTMLTMIYKLGLCAEKKWRKLKGFELLAKVISNVKFKDGIEINHENNSTESAA